MKAQKKTNAPFVAGIFVIVSTCIITGLTLVSSYYQLHSIPDRRAYSIYLALNLSHVAANLLLATVAFVGGVMSILRRNFTVAIVGAAFVLAISIFSVPSYSVQLLLFAARDFNGLLDAAPFVLGTATALILSILGVLLIAKSRAEFS